MQALITGVGGFAGSHLADHLLSLPNTEVWGCDRTPTPPPYLSEHVRLIPGDLRDPDFVRDLLRQSMPDRIYHLAGQAFVPQSRLDPWDTFETNLRPQLNFLEALAKEARPVRFLVVGSMEVYGRVGPEDLPIDEAQPFMPDSPYGLSKLAQDMMGLEYFLSDSLHVVRARPFPHIGPRQSDRFVAPAFASQLARIEAGLQPPVIRVGSLDARRDFTDVRDMVRAYHLLLEKGRPGEAYNIGCGRSRSIRELLDELLAMTHVEVRVEQDPERVRPVDLPDNACDSSKLRAQTGWTPEFSFATTLRDLLDYERERLSVASRH